MKSSATISRRLAWQALVEYQKSRQAPDIILDRNMTPGVSVQDSALAWEMTMGAVRLLKRLDFMAQAYIKAPVMSQKPEVLSALRLGFYQLTEMTGVPQYAAVDETVQLLSERSLERDAGFVNAVMRSFLREPERVKFPDADKEPLAYLSAFYSYPKWLVRRWLNRYGFDEARQMLAANNERPRTSFKVIRQKTDREKVLETLKDLNIDAEAGKYLPDFFSSRDGAAILRTDLFRQGYINVQDESQGLPIYLLDPPAGESVLDLCAAPGGKTIALADKIGPDGRVIALDRDAVRLGQVRENVKRTGFRNVDFICADVIGFAPERKFRYILLDVPCSDLGTLSQNADLRWKKKENDIRNLARIQSELLIRAAEMLDDSGILVYSTCTTEPDEIEDVATGFLAAHGDFQLESNRSDIAKPFETQEGVYRTWPHKHGIGGSGFARLRKRNGG